MWITCPVCRGSGFVEEVREDADGKLKVLHEDDCPQCHGDGGFAPDDEDEFEDFGAPSVDVKDED